MCSALGTALALPQSEALSCEAHILWDIRDAVFGDWKWCESDALRLSMS